MYRIGDCIVYNEEGVCRVLDVGCVRIASADKGQQYYTLQPLSGDGRVYVPVDTPLPMRRVLTRQEALQAIDRMPEVPAQACRPSSKRVLEEHYRALMKPHTPEALVATLKSVHAKRHDGEKLRTLSSTDEYYRKRAEGLLHQELAFALEIAQDEVEQFIIDRLGAEA